MWEMSPIIKLTVKGVYLMDKERNKKKHLHFVEKLIRKIYWSSNVFDWRKT